MEGRAVAGDKAPQEKTDMETGQTESHAYSEGKGGKREEAGGSDRSSRDLEGQDPPSQMHRQTERQTDTPGDQDTPHAAGPTHTLRGQRARWAWQPRSSSGCHLLPWRRLSTNPRKWLPAHSPAPPPASAHLPEWEGSAGAAGQKQGVPLPAPSAPGRAQPLDTPSSSACLPRGQGHRSRVGEQKGAGAWG